MEQENLQKQVEQHEKEKQELLRDIRRLRRKPDRMIGFFILSIGLFLLALAIYYSHRVSAFIGIALTFWGALLLYIRPIGFIRKDILDATIKPLESFYLLIEEMGFEGTPQHISPNTIWGQRNTVLYIPKSNEIIRPKDEQLSTDETLIENSKAIKISPPGQSLSKMIEDELKTNFATVDLVYLQNNLEKALVEGLEIAKAFHMQLNESNVQVEIIGAIFYEAIRNQTVSNKMIKIGDPLTSAIACILARSTRKPVVIEKIEIEPKEKIIKTKFKILDN